MKMQEIIEVMKSKYYIKTRGLLMSENEANLHGIRRVYNWTGDLGYMLGSEDMAEWAESLKISSDEAALVEAGMKEIEGQMIYVCSCILFHTIEMCNVYVMKRGYKMEEGNGFGHLYN